MTTTSGGLYLIVAGVPYLARALEQSGRFAKVYPVATAAGLQQLIALGELSERTNQDMAFVFSDSLPVHDTPGVTLGSLISKLTTVGFRVIVVAHSGQAQQLVIDNPATGLLSGPLTVNTTLGALAGLKFPGMEPVEGGFKVLPTDPVETPSTPQRQPLQPLANSTPQSATTSSPAPTEPPTRSAKAPASPAKAPTFVAPAPTRPVFSAPPPTSWNKPAALPESVESASPAEPAPSTPRPVLQPLAAKAPEANLQAAPADRPLPQYAPPVMSPPLMETATASASAGTTTARRLRPMGLGEAPTGAEAGPAPRGPAPRGQYGARTQGPKRRGFVIAVTVPKGGTGKSSLTLNLAAFLGLRLRASGRRVCIVDANFQQADAGKYLNVYAPNIGNMLRDTSLLTSDRIEKGLVHLPALNLSALLGPPSAAEASPTFLTPQLYFDIVTLLKEHFDYILIDTPVAERYHDLFSGFVLPVMDYMIVPVIPSIPTLMNTDGWLRAVTAPRYLQGEGVDPERLGIVLNRAKDAVGCSEDDVRANLASWRFIGAIPETDEWQLCNNHNELIAVKNYVELNAAFAAALYAATGEEALMDDLHGTVAPTGGLFSRIKHALRIG